jgi:CRISPR-associated protein Cas1
MIMAVVYLTEQGSKVRKTGDRLVVTSDGTELAELECQRVDTIMVFGNVQITTQALKRLLEHEIELAFFTKSGKLLGQLSPPTSKNIILRKAQYEKEGDESFSLLQSALLVEAKLKNCRAVILRYAYDNPSTASELRKATQDLERLALKALSAENISSLRGIEGTGARRYWETFGHMFKREDVCFNGRKKRPPPDPINAILSFGYTLLGNELRWLLDGMGFDPFLGIFHKEVYGRPSLALDLLEPYRSPVVDRFCVRLFNMRTVKPEDFRQDEEDGVRLSRDGMRKFFLAWEKRLQKLNVRNALKDSAENLARVFKGEEKLIEPYRWESF